MLKQLQLGWENGHLKQLLFLLLTCQIKGVQEHFNQMHHLPRMWREKCIKDPFKET